MNFRQAEKYLFSLGNEVSAMKLGLKSTSKLLETLGNPQKNYLKVQIAGTNGKGSVCAFLDAICRSASIRTGLTTSPHLISITERVMINGEQVSENAFAQSASRVRETAEYLVLHGVLETLPTFFEQVTVTALLTFAEQHVELAILETGLGGRLDATTAARAQIVALTAIDYDHEKILGEALSQIAAEKAAIIRPDTRVVIGEQKSEAIDVIFRACAKIGVKPELTQHVRVTNGARRLRFDTEQARYEVLRLGLLGRHQIENAKVAILLAEALQQNFSISRENIVRGLESAVHPGRLEHRGRFLFDGAHNVAGAEALRKYLDEFVSGPITMIFGAMKDKDVSRIADVLLPKAHILILTRPDNSRALQPDDLAARVPKAFPNSRVLRCESVKQALQEAEKATPPGGIIVVTGSLYLVGEAQKMLNN